MRSAPVSYEPVFGGMVAVLAAAFVCYVLFSARSPGTSHTGTAFLLIVSGNAMFWGGAQIVGYRNAKRRGTAQSPVLGTALGCALLGLLLALVAVLLHELTPERTAESLLTGGISALLLVVAAVVGIRQGVWRRDA
jgi:hypothetical protein